MVLNDQASKTLLEAASGETTPPMDSLSRAGDDLRSVALTYAYRAVTSCREYRETYGLKPVGGYIWQQAYNAAFILLADLQLHPNLNSKPAGGASDLKESNTPINDTRVAIEE